MRSFEKFFNKFIFIFAIYANVSCVNLSQSFAQSKRFEYNASAINEAYFFSTSIPQNGKVVYVENFLPKNYSNRGNIDYTQFIQEAFNHGNIIIMPNFPLLINSKGIDIGNNRTVYFQEKSALRMKANNLKIYYLLRVLDKENVTIINPRLIGDRDFHRGNEGEWGMGISMLGATNVQIINPRISHCWGDGIYIGRGAKTYCENIIIKGGYLDFNRRNGLSVISVKGLKINNLLISNTYGTAPMAAMDFEPNNSDEYLQKIFVNDLKTINNLNYEILCALYHYKSHSPKVELTFNNHSFRDNSQPLTVATTSKGQQKKLRGNIIYKNSIWQRNHLESLRSLYKWHDDILLTITGLRVGGISNNIEFKP